MSRKVVVLIQARLTSKRFPEKVLEKLYGDSTCIEVLHMRLKKSKQVDEIRYCIPDTSDNDYLAELLADLRYKYVRGSEHDLISRYQASTDDLSGNDLIVRVTSDCPLVDPDWVDTAVNRLVCTDSDYCSNYTPAENSLFCNGSDIEVFTKKTLNIIDNGFKDARDREHVTFPLWDGRLQIKHERLIPDDNQDFSDVRITLDYPEDLEVIRSILIEHNGIYPNLVRVVEIYRHLNLGSINCMHHYSEGW